MVCESDLISAPPTSWLCLAHPRRSRGKFRIRFAIDLQPVTSNLSLFRPFSCTISAANSHSIPWHQRRNKQRFSRLSWALATGLASEIQSSCSLAIPLRQYPIHNFAGLPQIQLRNASYAGTPTLPRLGLVSPRVAFDFCSPPIPPT